MKQPILHLTAKEPLDDDFDPLLGRSVQTDIFEEAASNQSDSSQGSVFDDPDLDFAFQAPVPEPIPSESKMERGEAQDTVTVDAENTITEIDEATETFDEKTTGLFESEPLIEPQNEEPSISQIPAELAETQTMVEAMPFEGIEPEIEQPQEAVVETEPEPEQEPEASGEPRVRTAAGMSWQDMYSIFNQHGTTDTSSSTSSSRDQSLLNNQEEIGQEVSKHIENEIEPLVEEVPINPTFSEQTLRESDNAQTVKEQIEGNQDDILATASDEQVLNQLGMAKSKTKKIKPKKSKKRKGKRTSNFVLFGGILTTGTAALMSLFAMLELLGPPFDLIAQLRWYWVIVASLGVLIWGTGRQWLLVALSLIVAVTNYIAINSTLGQAPIGGTPKATIGYGNIGGNISNLAPLLAEAETNKADVLMISGVGNNQLQAPANWSVLINAPNNDPSAFTVFAKAGWLAAAQTGEPIIIRPATSWFTLIGLNPIAPSTKGRENPDRDSVINRAANRAGAEELPILVIGDFEVPSWTKQLTVFVHNGDITRIRCGGTFGSNYDNKILGFSADHAFVRGLGTSSCKIGARIGNSKRHSMWVAVAPTN